MNRMKVDLSKVDTPEIHNLIREELDAIKNDPLVYPTISNELKLTHKEAERFLASLLDYRDDVHYCAGCPGLENCAKGHPHFRLRLERDGEVLTRHYDPCEKMLSLSSFQKRYLRCSFPVDWRDAVIKKARRSAVSRNEALKEMYFVSLGKSERWIYLTGNVGSGKSYLLACLANVITKEKGKGVFSDSESLLSELKDMSIEDHESFEKLFDSICNCSILVLDDFGNEYKTEYVYTSILFPILSYRDKANLPTAFSSDFSIDQIVSMYKSKIGPERATQLSKLLKRRCGKAFDITGDTSR